MIEQSVIENLADLIIKLEKELSRRGFPISFTMAILSQLTFHQFNGTRNDTKLAFDRLVQALEKKEKKGGQ
jgi:hypothetical protein